MDKSIVAIIIIILTVISFVAEKLPLAVTALISSLAMGITGAMDLTDIYAGFGSTTVMMVIGMMIIGDALFKTGIAERIGQKVLGSGIVKSEEGFLVLTVALAGTLSAFLSNTAVIAMFIPLIRSIARESKGKIKSRNIVLATGFASTIGGAATMVGSTPQLVAQGILAETEGVRQLGFWEPGILGWPLMVLLVGYMALVGYKQQQKILPGHVSDNPKQEAEEVLHIDRDTPAWKGYLSVLVIILSVIGFALGIWNVGVIALMGACILFAFRVVDFQESMGELDWNTVVILGAAQGFAKGLDASGGGSLIANSIIDLFGSVATPFVIYSILVVITIILTNFMSNTAVTAMLVPIAIEIAFTLGADPITFVLGIVVGSQVAIATPIGTASVTQTLVEGYQYSDYVKIGFPITVLSTALILVIPLFFLGF